LKSPTNDQRVIDTVWSALNGSDTIDSNFSSKQLREVWMTINYYMMPLTIPFFHNYLRLVLSSKIVIDITNVIPMPALEMMPLANDLVSPTTSPAASTTNYALLDRVRALSPQAKILNPAYKDWKVVKNNHVMQGDIIAHYFGGDNIVYVFITKVTEVEHSYLVVASTSGPAFCLINDKWYVRSRTHSRRDVDNGSSKPVRCIVLRYQDKS
jgi:hypothetical protein